MLIPSLFDPGASEDTVNGLFPVSLYGAHSNGTDDDMPALIACVAACMAAHGGRVLIDVPLWLKGTVDIPGGLWDGLASGASNLIIQGMADASTITVDCAGKTPFAFSNWNQVSLLDLVFVGGPTTPTCDYVIFGTAWQMFVERCVFMHLQATTAVLGLYQSNRYMSECKFGSCGAVNQATIYCPGGGSFVMEKTHFIDYGWANGINYNGRSTNGRPWVKYRGNGSTGAQPTGGGDGVAVHLSDCYFDENANHALDVAKEDGAGSRIRNVAIDNCSGNYAVLLSEAYSISGVDSVKIEGGDWGWNTVTTSITLRDVRFARIDRFFSATASKVDADNTVTAAEILECNGLSKSSGWAAGHTVMRYNGVDV